MNLNRTLAVVQTMFNAYPNTSRPDKHLIDLLEITLFNNDFKLGDTYFIQNCGKPIGKIYAPSLANMYHIDFDKKKNYRRL